MESPTGTITPDCDANPDSASRHAKPARRRNHPGQSGRIGKICAGAMPPLISVVLAACGSGGGPPTHTVGGVVSGLFGTGLVLENNGAEDLSLAVDGRFAFPTRVVLGTRYTVTIKAQPTAPIQVCTIENAAGAVGNSDVTNVNVSCGALALLAGALGGPGSVDGRGSSARFIFPAGVATDSLGNLYVADDTIIRKITSDGTVTTLAGAAGDRGVSDGTGGSARFSYADAIATDAAGNMYVSDSGNDTIRKITPAGMVTTLAGAAGQVGSADGVGGSARFSNLIEGIATDRTGNVYVADGNNDTIRKITPNGLVSTLAGAAGQAGSSNGTGGSARFLQPLGLATDSMGSVYVGDSCAIRKITPDGAVTTFAGTINQCGYADGAGSSARLTGAMGLAIDSTGNVYASDRLANTIRKITPDNVVSTLAGTPQGTGGYSDGTGSSARFSLPIGLATDVMGNVYVADSNNYTIRKISPSAVVSTLAGAIMHQGDSDGTGSAARFGWLGGITMDPSGTVYVADTGANTIRKITPGGVVSTLAGSPLEPGSADGVGTAARFGGPTGIAADAAGNLYVADGGNNTIRKITPGGMVSTLAGAAGQWGSSDGIGGSARFFGPRGIATDQLSNVYVADSANNTIRKITPDGMVSTLAGSAGQNGFSDGAGSAARFSDPAGVATDLSGNVYVTDIRNRLVRKITPDGVVSTVAGAAGEFGSWDVNGWAELYGFGVATDSMGVVYFCDTSGHTIRKIDPRGVVTTIVGTPESIGIVLGPLPGSLNAPVQLAVSPGASPRLFVNDVLEGAVLEINLP